MGFLPQQGHYFTLRSVTDSTLTQTTLTIMGVEMFITIGVDLAFRTFLKKKENVKLIGWKIGSLALVQPFPA